MDRFIRKAAVCLLTTLVLTSVCGTALSAASYRKGANSASSSYRTGKYYDHFQKVPLTGDGRTDVLAVALSQVGYQEGGSVSQLGGTTGTAGNFTEYNYNMGDFSQGYGGKNYPWCASFVSFCLYQAGCTDQGSLDDWCRKHEGDSRYIWREVSCNRWAKQLRLCKYFKDSAAFGGTYTPQSADLIFFTKDGQIENHIGLVLYVQGNTVYTVEGNTSSASGLESNGGGVYVKSYALTDSCIRGYGVLPYQVAPHHEVDYAGKAPTAGIYMATANKYVYTTPTATTHKWLLTKFTLVAVTGVAENGRLAVVCKIGGAWVEGYVKNNSDRVIQLSSFGMKQVDTERYALDKSTFTLKELPPPMTEAPTEPPVEAPTVPPTEEPPAPPAEALPTGPSTDDTEESAPPSEETDGEPATDGPMGCKGVIGGSAVVVVTLGIVGIFEKRKEE